MRHKVFAISLALLPVAWLACSEPSSSPVAPAGPLSSADQFIRGGSPTSPHWIVGDPPQTYCDNTTLTCYFKLTGLGNNQLVTITVSASVLFDYDCQNGGLHIPKPFTGVAGTATGSQTFDSGRNGQITGSISLNPSTLVSGAANCPPPPQKGILGPWQAVNVEITSATNFGLQADGTSPLAFHLSYP